MHKSSVETIMDDRRRSSRRLLHDVKTKSIEKTLLPLINQVSAFIRRVKKSFLKIFGKKPSEKFHSTCYKFFCEWTDHHLLILFKDEPDYDDDDV